MAITVPNASLERTASGTQYSRGFDDVYHSERGGLPQARHVFLAGNGLPARWPARNPEAWSPAVVRELARLAAPGATLATWTVAGGVRAALGDAGFAIEKRPGFGPKREMLAGMRDGTPRIRTVDRRALVVGAGL